MNDEKSNGGMVAGKQQVLGRRWEAGPEFTGPCKGDCEEVELSWEAWCCKGFMLSVGLTRALEKSEDNQKASIIDVFWLRG